MLKMLDFFTFWRSTIFSFTFREIQQKKDMKLWYAQHLHFYIYRCNGQSWFYRIFLHLSSHWEELNVMESVFVLNKLYKRCSFENPKKYKTQIGMEQTNAMNNDRSLINLIIRVETSTIPILEHNHQSIPIAFWVPQNEHILLCADWNEWEYKF